MEISHRHYQRGFSCCYWSQKLIFKSQGKLKSKTQDQKDGVMEALSKERTPEFRYLGQIQRKRHLKTTFYQQRILITLTFKQSKKVHDLENHLYIIKLPLEGFYESLDHAKSECRTHLICKNLMKKFMKTLREKHEQKNKPHNQYPEIYYSDILILQDDESNYIVQKKENSGLQKEQLMENLNNNWGFINDNLTPINQLEQAFTQFTYYISNFEYMINDIQGVGVFFTEPAVNTSSGEYDDKDMGVEGQSRYLVNFQCKSHICRDILDVMDILIQ